ncbi:MAG: hypothetical protein LBC98_10425 [Prevotellaceae bacterium]|jgi:hypothetical protein|nr:hypothetical protein [Prevotellaceae bacterium]
MRTINYLFGVLFLALALTACSRKNEEKSPAFPPPSAEEFAGVRQSFFENLVQEKSFDASTGLTFTSDKGVEVNISYLTNNGALVTGDVQLKYVELFDIGTIALANKPLLGKGTDGKVAPLVTGGEFFIKATQNGTELDGIVDMKVPVALTQADNPEQMTGWSMDDDSTIWEQGKRTQMDFVGGATGTQADSYYCWFPFGWTNIDWLISLPGEKTELRVKVPPGYNGSNCAVYAAYLSIPSTLAAFDIYVKDGEYFTEHTGIAPIGFQMFIIFVSADEKGEKFVYATKLVTVAANQYITFTDDDLHSATAQQVIAAINGLYN